MSISAINARNQFKGTVQEIIRGPVLSEVDVQTVAGIITSTYRKFNRPFQRSRASCAEK